MYQSECTADFSDSCCREFAPEGEEHERELIDIVIGAGYKAKIQGWIFSLRGTVCPMCAMMIASMSREQDTDRSEWIDPVTGEPT